MRIRRSAGSASAPIHDHCFSCLGPGLTRAPRPCRRVQREATFPPNSGPGCCQDSLKPRGRGLGSRRGRGLDSESTFVRATRRAPRSGHASDCLSARTSLGGPAIGRNRRCRELPGARVAPVGETTNLQGGPRRFRPNAAKDEAESLHPIGAPKGQGCGDADVRVTGAAIHTRSTGQPDGPSSLEWTPLPRYYAPEVPPHPVVA